MNKKQTYRHRNSKTNWSAGPHYTFWVGQRVVRSWERKNYIDKIGQVGVVTALPETRAGYLTVAVEGKDETSEWRPTECAPLKAHYEEQRKRFVSVSRDFAAARDRLDENGFPLPESGD